VVWDIFAQARGEQETPALAKPAPAKKLPRR
jgi:hypothetical protein